MSCKPSAFQESAILSVLTALLPPHAVVVFEMVAPHFPKFLQHFLLHNGEDVVVDIPAVVVVVVDPVMVVMVVIVT